MTTPALNKEIREFLDNWERRKKIGYSYTDPMEDKAVVLIKCLLSKVKDSNKH